MAEIAYVLVAVALFLVLVVAPALGIHYWRTEHVKLGTRNPAKSALMIWVIGLDALRLVLRPR